MELSARESRHSRLRTGRGWRRPARRRARSARLRDVGATRSIAVLPPSSSIFPGALGDDPLTREAIRRVTAMTRRQGPLRGPTRRSGVPVTALTLSARRRRTESSSSARSRGAVLIGLAVRDRHRAARGRRRGVAVGAAACHLRRRRATTGRTTRRPPAKPADRSADVRVLVLDASRVEQCGRDQGERAARPRIRDRRNRQRGADRRHDRCVHDRLREGSRRVGEGGRRGHRRSGLPRPAALGRRERRLHRHVGYVAVGVVQPAAASWSASQSRLVRAAARSRRRRDRVRRSSGASASAVWRTSADWSMS